MAWAGVHADGRIELAGTANDIGDSREVFYRARPAGSTAWGTWTPLGDNGFDGALVAAIARDGGLEVVIPNRCLPRPGPGGNRHTAQAAQPRRDLDLLGPAGSAGGFGEGTIPALIPGPKDMLELFAISAAGAVWRNSQPAGGSWSGWAPQW